MSEMKTMGDAIGELFKQRILSGQIHKGGVCPQCGEDMLIFCDRKNNKPRSLPVCPQCGHKETRGAVPQTQIEAVQWTLEAQKKDACNYLINSSVFADKSVVDKNFNNFKTSDAKQSAAKKVALKIVTDIMAGDPVSGIFTGNTGTGKTHLAMSIIYAVMERSKFKKHAIFINYRELLNETKRSMGDRENQKKYAHLIAEELKKADLVVIDDLGSEVGDDNGTYQATQYDIDLVTSIYDGRTGKATITTTNRTGKELRQIYGSRVISRITQHSKDHTFLFREMQDYRMKGVTA